MSEETVEEIFDEETKEKMEARFKRETIIRYLLSSSSQDKEGDKEDWGGGQVQEPWMWQISCRKGANGRQMRVATSKTMERYLQRSINVKRRK